MKGGKRGRKEMVEQSGQPQLKRNRQENLKVLSSLESEGQNNSASSASEADPDQDYSTDDMGCTDLTPEQIQRIQTEGDNGDVGGDATAPQDQPEVENKQNKLRSEVWKHFIRGPTKENGGYDAFCIHCKRRYEMGKGRGTGSMKHHMIKGCKSIPSSQRHKPTTLQKLLQTNTTAGEPNLVAWEFDQNTCRKSLGRMVIAHEYPFNCVTHHFFKVFLSDLCPRFKVMKSGNTLRADCMKVYEEERSSLYELLNKLDSRVSFTSDLWSNKKGDKGYMALTCHYIDENWKLRKRTLNFCNIETPHTGKVIADAIYARLVQWNLDRKAFCLCLDNASSNDACVNELLTTSLKDVLPAGGAIFHLRCGCHILNLIVQDGLSCLGKEISKIRNTMMYIRHLQVRMERFLLAVSQAKCPNKKPAWDVSTRWNSTYLMLELAIQLKPAIVRYATLETKYNLLPTEEEWEQMSVLLGHLKVFYVATLKLSGTKYPTLNLYFPEMCEVFLNIKKMQYSPYPFVVKMGKAMFLKWDKYWKTGNTLLAIACVLDPRCKLTVIEYYIKMLYPSPGESQRFVESLKGCIDNLLKEYIEAHAQSSSDVAGPSSQQGSGPTSIALDTVSDTRAGLKVLLEGQNSSAPIKGELEQYLEDSNDKTPLDAQFDILLWWKVNGPKHPALARLTRDVLAVPVSTVASESTFSTSGRTLSPVRNSLSDETLEVLICAQDWLQAPVIENGGEVGGLLWPDDDAATNESICGNGAA